MLNKEHSYLLWEKGEYAIRREMLANVRDEIADIAVEHWEEIAGYKDTVPLDPLWEYFEDFEKTGRLFVFTLRENDKLIGYSVFWTGVHLHYRSLNVATNDLLFVTKSKRHGRLGLQLIIECEKYLKTRGVNKLTWHMKPHKSFAPLLERLGYKHEELIYGKLI